MTREQTRKSENTKTWKWWRSQCTPSGCMFRD